MNNKVLFGIKKDGDIYFGYGVPTQVKDYIQSKILEIPLDEYNDVVSFVGDLIEGGDLAALLGGKVNTETGKSLIPTKYIQEVDNPEFIKIITDANGRILFGIDDDGNIYGRLLKSVSSEKEEIIVNLIFDRNTFIARDGNISKTTSNYGLSQPVRVFKGDRVNLKVKSNSGGHVLAICDEKGTVIKPVITASDAIYNEYCYDIERSGYIMVSGNISNTYDYPILLKIERSCINQIVYSVSKNVFEDTDYKLNRHYYFENSNFTPENYGKILCYEGDTKVDTSHIVNSVSYPNGEIIACRDNGTVVKITNDGVETVLLTISGAVDWRGCYIDSNNNVYVSPHHTFGSGSLSVTNRGLYRLAYGEQAFTKVLALYNPDSSIETETQNNDDTIWTMCEDSDGILYAGVYAHTVRANPSIYKSSDNGVTWTLASNLLEDGYVEEEYSDTGHPRHIHCVIYNRYDDALYCLVGEVETVFKSTDKGDTWVDLNIRHEEVKGTTLIAVPDGVLIGSDGTRLGVISKIYSDEKTVRTVARMWHGEFFAMRKSDVTGWIYAFTKIESTINNGASYPPIEANSDPSALADWIENADAGVKIRWEMYNEFVSSHYNHDAIHPTNAAILVSKDNGETWTIIYKFNTNSATGIGAGFFCVGYFRNGECLCGLSAQIGNAISFVNPIIISEGRHKFSENGMDLSGEIYNKTNN